MASAMTTPAASADLAPRNGGLEFHERRSYFYAHLRRPAYVHRGERVFTGERIGAVGETGNARTVGCHLHFEIHVDGRPIDPEPALQRWDRYSWAPPRAARMKSDFASV